MAEQEAFMSTVSLCFSPPTLNKVLNRSRLFARLDSARSAWIAAPPGYGKTTLVGSYLQQREVPHLWFRIDRSATDPAAFFNTLEAGFRQLFGGRFRLPRYGAECEAGPDGYARSVAAQIRSHLTGPYLLVLDDYHLIGEGSELHHILPRLAQSLADDVSLFVLSRTWLPDAWGSVEANYGIDTIGQDELAFTQEEARELLALVSPDQTPSEATLDHIYSQSSGWVTGLMLLAHSRGSDVLDPEMSGNRERVFRYYAGELLAPLDTETHDFLLISALLPSMSPAAAAAVTGCNRSKRLLAELYRKNYFTQRHGDWPYNYRYHPLFRQFLLERLEERYPDERLLELRRKAAKVLETDDPAEAVALYLDAEACDEATRVLKREAEALLARGCWQSLLYWIERIPEEVLEGQPWLLYWQGKCLLHCRIPEAREQLSRAYFAFKAERLGEAVNEAWCAIVQSYLLEFGTYVPLDKWLDQLKDLDDSGLLPKGIATQLRRKVLLFAALMFRRPDDSRLAELERSLYRLVLYLPVKREQRLMVAAHLLRYYLWTGNLRQSKIIIERMGRIARHPTISPFSRLLWMLCNTMYSWYGLSPEAGIEACESGLALAQDTAIQILDFSFLTQGAYAALSLGDVELAESFVKRMPAVISDEQTIHLAHHQYFVAWLEFHRGLNQQALARMQSLPEPVEQAGVPYLCVHTYYGLAQAEFRCGNVEEANAINNRACELARRYHYAPLTYLTLLNRAQFALSRDDFRSADEALREALALGREQDYRHLPFWTHEDYTSLLLRALQCRIESQYVHCVIAAQKISPGEAVGPFSDWPWPVRIYTLGRFEIVLNDVAVVFTGKVQRRPLDLLKLLVVSREGASVQAIADQLWPQANGDTGRQSLKVTLSRLRELIGKEAVIQRSGRIALNPAYCWADAWAVTALTEKPGKQAVDALMRRHRELEQLYAGSFLPEDDHLSWVVVERERMNKSYLDFLAGALERLLAAHHYTEAAEIGWRGLAIDELAEEFYRGLIQANDALGRRHEAVRTYRRCQRTFSERLAIEPSAETKSLFAHLHAQTASA